jgi:repressor LexA
MAKQITPKQQQILDCINTAIMNNGYPPSVREICLAVGLKSTSTVHGYLQVLEKKGLIQRDPSKPRAVKVMNSKPSKRPEFKTYKEMIEVPIVGKVTAGQPILALENIEDTMPLPIDFVQNGDAFILKVQGDSMIEAGILDKDYIVVRQQSSANNGDIVVALLEDEATVKRFYKEKNCIRLQPENPFMEPIFANNVSIMGKVVGVFRKVR